MRNFAAVFVCGIVLLVVLLSVGCQEIKQEFSNTLHEEAVVVDAVYTPPTHDSQIGLTAVKVGPAGMDFSGDFGIRVGGGLQISDVTVPEKFAVVFKCQHGQFIITRKQVYEKFKDQKDKVVDVAYREVYRTTYETKDGKKRVVERVLVDYNFLDATLK